MDKNEERIFIEEAKMEVASVCRRLGLLHLAFAEVLVDELGKGTGERLITKAIENYGKKIGEKKRETAISRGLELTPENFRKVRDLPKFGMHEGIEEIVVEGERRIRAYGCVMAKVWHEYDKDNLGRFYCYVDPVNAMAFNPQFKMIHTKALPDGDEFCEFAIIPTTEKEREDFRTENIDWAEADNPSSK
jgi:predicted hydrocarbon binding protein